MIGSGDGDNNDSDLGEVMRTMMMMMMTIYVGINESFICFSTCLTKTSFHKSSPVIRGCLIFPNQTQYFRH